VSFLKNLSVLFVRATLFTPSSFIAIITIATAITTALGMALRAEAATLSVDENFAGSKFLGESQGFFPPDTQGAVGPSDITEFVNGEYDVYDKTGNHLQSSTLNQFWTNAGVSFNSFTYDPRVVYDPFSNRWYAAAADNPGQQNNFLLAVSKTSDPTAGWTGFTINSDSTGTRWADYPTLGFNNDGVYLAANMFSINGSNCSQCTTTIVAVPKSSLLAGTDANYTKFENQSPNSIGFSVQPVVNLDNNGLPEALLSSYNTPGGLLKRSDITGSINAPSTVQLNGSHGNTNPAASINGGSSTTSIGSTQLGNPIAVTDPDLPALPIFSVGQASAPTLSTNNGFISSKPYNTAPSAQQPGGPNTIDTSDTRLSSNVVLKNGIIWGVQDVQNPNSNRAAMRFFKIRASDNTVLQDQLIGDPNSDYYYGSIAVNSPNDVVIGFSRSSSQEYASSYAVLGEPDSSGNIMFNTPVLLHSGQASYQQLDGNSTNRWGDYSATVLDPSDPSGSTFWTFQETADVVANSWDTEITQLKISQPANVPEPSSLLDLLTFGALITSSLLKRKSVAKL